MKHAALKTAVAGVALAAGLGTVALAAPAGAATPATQHCSAWKQAGSTHYYIKECAQVVMYKTGKHIKETAYLKNTGKHHLTVSGFTAISYGQAGDGAEFTGVTVAPGKHKQITHVFSNPMSGPYTALSSLTAGGHTVRVTSTFKK